jgi:hypothetical protein
MNFVTSSTTFTAPLVFLQSASNKREVQACTNCGCTTVHDQLHHLSTVHDVPSSPSRQPNEHICAFGCGATYCSAPCRLRHCAMGHQFLCVGPHDEGHPLYKYMVLSLESGGAYEEFMMAAQIVVGSLLATNTGSTGLVATPHGTSALTEQDNLNLSQMVAVWQDATALSSDQIVPWW